MFSFEFIKVCLRRLREFSTTRNIKSRLAIKFPVSYEWWSNALPPGQEKASNAGVCPWGGGDVEASIWLVHKIEVTAIFLIQDMRRNFLPRFIGISVSTSRAAGTLRAESPSNGDSSSETQGQLVGAGESLNGWAKKFERTLWTEFLKNFAKSCILFCSSKY